jgi:hypothetical protein
VLGPAGIGAQRVTPLRPSRRRRVRLRRATKRGATGAMASARAETGGDVGRGVHATEASRRRRPSRWTSSTPSSSSWPNGRGLTCSYTGPQRCGCAATAYACATTASSGAECDTDGPLAVPLGPVGSGRPHRG